MREIKFRVWDVQRKVLANVTSIMWLSEDEIEIDHDKNGLREPFQINEDTAILEQFTGFHDSTTWKELTEQERKDWTMNGHMPSEWRGREVYEGDVVLVEKFRKGVIRYLEKEALFAVDFSSHLSRLCDTTSDYIEIIGNIHDKPELVDVTE